MINIVKLYLCKFVLRFEILKIQKLFMSVKRVCRQFYYFFTVFFFAIFRLFLIILHKMENQKMRKRHTKKIVCVHIYINN